MKLTALGPETTIYEEYNDEEEATTEGSFIFTTDDAEIKIEKYYQNTAYLYVNGKKFLEIRAGLQRGGDWDDYEVRINRTEEPIENVTETPENILYIFKDGTEKRFSSREEYERWNEEERWADLSDE